MPKFTFHCSNCGHSAQKITSVKRSDLPCDKCGSLMIRQMPTLNGAVQVTETIDPLTNAKWKKDQEEMLKERQEDYYWAVEVPRFIQTYSVETCLEQGWCYIDDHGKIQPHTKPPHKR
jgi:transcription elongation factor Elf1